MPELADLKALIHDHEAKDTGLTVDIAMCMQTWLVTELAELEAEKAAEVGKYEGSMAAPDTADLDAEIAAKQAEVEAATITLHFKALTKPKYNELLRAHKFDEDSTDDQDDAFLGALTEKCYQGITWQGSEFTRDQLPWGEAEEKFVAGEVDPIYGEVLLINRANKSRRPFVEAIEEEPAYLERLRLCARMQAWPSEMEQWPTPDRETDIEMMLALADVEADICTGCGGYLSKTTVHDHGYRVHTKSCSRCEALSKYSKGQAVIDEFFEGTPQAEIPEARRLFVEPIPLPEDLA